jgi:hypothetical protein
MSKKIKVDDIGYTDQDYVNYCDRNGHIHGTCGPVFAYSEDDDGVPTPIPLKELKTLPEKGKMIWTCEEWDFYEVPHFHVTRNPNTLRLRDVDIHGTQISTSIMIGDARYLPHHNHTETLTDQEIKALVQILDGPCREGSTYPVWKCLLEHWNSEGWAHGNYYELDLDMPRPLYEDGIL